ncbi:MAG: D-inositol-3-phosphate glycosyltransferase [Actinomycetota bacterium]
MRFPRKRRRSEGPRVAVVSLHTSPADQPGTGDAGGMNVYVREAAERMARRGLLVDVFTRRRDRRSRDIEDLGDGSRLIQVEAGPPDGVAKEELHRLLPEFLEGVLHRTRVERTDYDLVHAHYWLSGWVGQRAKTIWQVPLVASFHTLGKVKNRSLALGEEPEPLRRLEGEDAVVADADRIMAATPAEAAQLVGLYRADASRIRVVPPGVDHAIFHPRDREAARRELHLAGARIVLFVGRLQAHKGPDVAVRTLAEAVQRDPEHTRHVILAIVGGPSGSGHGADVARLMDLAASLGIADRVMLFPPQPQERLAEFYAAADAVLVPSRSESFGLVALEALACGTPVVAAAVGGLRYVVDDGVTGFLVEGHDPRTHADRLLALLRDPEDAAAMGRRAALAAAAFSWEATTAEIAAVYRELLPPA